MNTPDDNQLSLFSTPEPFLKSSFCDWEIDQEGYENSIEISGYKRTENEVSEIQKNDNTDTKCSDTWISLAESEASALQQNSLEESRQLSLWRSTPTLKQSCDRNSQEYQFTQTSETTTQNLESLTLSQWDSPALAHPTQELERDSNIQLHLFGERDLDALSKLNPASVLSNNLKELSNEDFELFLADSLWQDTLGKLAMCRQQSLARVIKGSGCLSFPTLTSNVSSTSRPAGQTKCEKWFKDNGLIKNGYQLGTQAIALTMGFPSSWFEDLSEQYSKNQTTPSQVKPQAESEQDISQDEQLHQPKQPLPSAESSTSQKLLGGSKNLLEHKENKHSLSDSGVLLGGGEKLLEHKEHKRSSLSRELSIPCIVKQPKQPEVKGVIRKDEGDRFLVEVDGEEISISKLFVYPDLNNCSSKKTAAEQDRKVSDISVKCSSNISPPSTKSSSKTRRQKGEGSGHIYYRTVARNGKSYRQAYYQWRENGKQRTKYISKKLLSRVEEAEARKLPVEEILVLLGGMDKCSSKSSSTSIASIQEKAIGTNDECSSKVTPPSAKRRKQGEGTGYIECKPIKRSGKEYKQYWYHYEEWEGGDRTVKKSRYIPKRLIQQIERMNDEKAAVREILEVFQSKRKK